MIIEPGSLVPLPFTMLPLVSIMCCVGKSYGRGTIEYVSASPRARPIIESRLLVHGADRARAVEGLQLAVELARTPAMRNRARFFWSPARVLTRPSVLERWIGRICDSSYHPCGTVPMGADDASLDEAACDGRGRVRGVAGLWVADASAMPTIPSAHTNLTTLMMGERFGEWARDGGL